jgi:hypothetical protein
MGVASGFADLVSGFSEKLATDDKARAYPKWSL